MHFSLPPLWGGGRILYVQRNCNEEQELFQITNPPYNRVGGWESLKVTSVVAILGQDTCYSPFYKFTVGGVVGSYLFGLPWILIAWMAIGVLPA